MLAKEFSFFSLPYKVYSSAIVIVLNVPALKCLTSVSVNHLLETPHLPGLYLRQKKFFSFHICFNLHIYRIKQEALIT